MKYVVLYEIASGYFSLTKLAQFKLVYCSEIISAPCKRSIPNLVCTNCNFIMLLAAYSLINNICPFQFYGLSHNFAPSPASWCTIGPNQKPEVLVIINSAG